jgi:gluconokinase
MHGLIALDKDMTPITPLITWADGRAASEARALHDSGLARRLQSAGGAPVHPMTPLVKIMWFAHRDDHTWRGARWWIGLKDYLILWLTGTLATELSSASGTGLLALATRDWNPEALDLCGVSPGQLPPILAPTTVLKMAPEAACQTGLPAGTPVVVGAADGPLANVGVGATTPGVAGLSLGTTGAVRMTFTAPQSDSSGALFCYALAENMWVVGGAIGNGGDFLRWTEEALLPDLTASNPDAAVLELAASVEAGSEGLAMLPFLRPERAPLWLPGVAGAYLGLRRHHTRAHMVRAGIEAICLEMRFILDRLDTLERVRMVRATGGAFRSQLLQQMMAAAAGRAFHVLDEEEGTALGAARLGLWASGAVPNLDAAVTALAGAAGAMGSVVEPPGVMVEAFTRLRAEIPELLEALQQVVSLLFNPTTQTPPPPRTGLPGTRPRARSTRRRRPRPRQ